MVDGEGGELSVSVLFLQYTILSGHPPFHAQSASTEDIMDRIKGGRFSLNGEEWTGVSNAARSVIKGEWVGGIQWTLGLPKL
jgi:hypothetical protein